MSRKDEKDAVEAARTRAEVLSSAVTEARAAFARGDGYYELAADLRTLGEVASLIGPGMTGPGPTDVLSLVEAEGWVLLQANHVFMFNGARTDSNFSRHETKVDGQIVGVYVFRRRAGTAAPPAPPGVPGPPGPPGAPGLYGPPGASPW